MSSVEPEDTHVLDLASIMWNNPIIRSRICDLADRQTLTVVARLHRDAFVTAVQHLWGGECHSLRRLDDLLGTVADYSVYEGYENQRVPSLMPLVARFPALRKCRDDSGELGNLLWTWVRAYDGEIADVSCTLEAFVPNLADDVRDAIEEAESVIGIYHGPTTRSIDLHLTDLKEAQEVVAVISKHRYSVNELAICLEDYTDDMAGLVKYIAEHCPPRIAHFYCDCVPYRTPPAASYLDLFDAAMQSIPRLLSSGTISCSLHVHGEEAAQHLAHIARAFKSCVHFDGSLFIGFAMPTESQIDDFKSVPLEPWRDDNYIGAHQTEGHLQQVQVKIQDPYDDLAELPAARAGRHFRSAAWMRYLAHFLLNLFGPLADYDLSISGDETIEGPHAAYHELADAHRQITETSSQASQMIMRNTIAEIIRETRDGRTPGWKKMIKGAEQIESTDHEGDVVRGSPPQSAE